MSFQGYQGEVNPQVGHEIQGKKRGAQMMQLTQVQLAQIVGNGCESGTNPTCVADSEQPTNSSCSKYHAVVQQVQAPIKFGVPVFESDTAASWLAWSQRVVHQVRLCGFEAELTAAEG